jgi:hypothetical protein
LAIFAQLGVPQQTGRFERQPDFFISHKITGFELANSEQKSALGGDQGGGKYGKLVWEISRLNLVDPLVMCHWLNGF